MCNEQSLDHNICQGLARQVPTHKVSDLLISFAIQRKIVEEKDIEISWKLNIRLLTRPTKLSADPITSNELGRRSCGLPGVD